MKTRNITYLILSTLLFLSLFVVYDTNFHGPDEPIYFAYTASIVDDGDLNAVNHLNSHYPYYLPSGKVGISKTYNLPDFHNYGGVVLWVPFYAYAKSIYFIATKLNITSLISYGLDKLTKCALSFSTVTFGFFTALLTYMLCKVFFSNNIAIWSTLMIFIGTPFFYYILFEGGNANIVACLFSILSIWFCSYTISMKRSHWFLYGLFFSICMVVKVDLWFQIFFIFFFFITLLMLRKTTWINGIYFLIGLVPGFTLKIVNDYIKYGIFHVGELGLFNFKNFYFLEQLFSSYRGFFYTSPILYICLWGFVLVGINLLRNAKLINEKRMQDLFFFILGSYLFIKILLLSYRYAWGGGTYGARPLLTEFPIFVLLYARTIKYRKRYLMYFVAIASVFFVFWNLLLISEYMAGLDLGYVTGTPDLNARIKTLKVILDPLFHVKDMDLKSRLCLPLFLIFFGLTFYIVRFIKPIDPSFWYVRNQNRIKPFKISALFTIYLCTAYTLITVLNIYNNKRNVKKLKVDEFFENAQIIAPHEFEKSENVGSMNEMITYFKLKGDIDRVNKIKRYKKEIYGEDR